MRSIFLICLFGVLLLISCNFDNRGDVTINFKLPDYKDVVIKVALFGASPLQIVDSVKLSDNGEGVVKLDVDSPSVYILDLNSRKQLILIVLPGEKIEVSTRNSSAGNDFIITGSPETALYLHYYQATEENNRKAETLSARFATERGRANFASVKTTLDSAYIHLFNQQKDLAKNFMASYPKSLASWIVLGSSFGPNPLFSKENDPELFVSLDSTLSLHYPNASILGALHSISLDIRNQTSENNRVAQLLATGQPLPEINLPAANGSFKSTKSLHGKIVLLYFWKSWSAPSRQLNLELAAYYPQWKSKGFEIFAVSLDTDEKLWRNACQLDKAYWINVLDKEGLESHLAHQFGIKKLPSLVLIDREGKIISAVNATDVLTNVNKALTK